MRYYWEALFSVEYFLRIEYRISDTKSNIFYIDIISVLEN